MTMVFGILGFFKKLASWKGFTSWKFWAGLLASAMLGWVLFTNYSLQGQVAKQERDLAVASQQLDSAIDKNQELKGIMVRVRAGEAIDDSLIVSNQKEIDNLRTENDKRIEEVRRQGSSGPASSAAICAITRVCD